MQLFFLPQLEIGQTSATFSPIESQHIIKVLRKKNGDFLWITNGKGYVFKGEIISDHARKCQVQIISFDKKEKNRTYTIQIAIAPTKNMDRLEWFVEKATEIGIDEIILIQCDHSERKVVKTERLEKVAIAALKQSAQYHLPFISELVPIQEVIQKDFDGERYIAHCEPTKKESFEKILQPKKNVQIFIGPEGDFSPKEILWALENNIHAVALGKNRLRTETAGIVAVHTVALANE